ncbi:transcription factor MYB88-like [Andrographis paniculata]|uniref:transcription factor MYB88-like n=1 Tax=Andrographis paniculata TaxID=175694 RepID=UPI0021E6E4E7|nr:transcription factor MYB88-like [Andrographis paniculata]
MKKNNISASAAAAAAPKRKKEWHIVSWSQEEDDILRDQIRVHGIENWAVIASRFKDKTARQCRRRWFTYLNSDFKKGGWSPEEDMLLCEAQKMFGNRWTEIAKVVSGRTDNAVKNRFATLCKRRAKHDAAMAKENTFSCYINLNNKRVIFPNGNDDSRGDESSAPLKKTRISSTKATENRDECNIADHRVLRHPFQVIAQNTPEDESNKVEGAFLKKDDPKVLALMQQAELLSSLAVKINSEKTDQSLESAWTAIQDFLKQNKEVVMFRSQDTDFQIEKLRELVEDLTSSNGWSRHAASPASSEYSTGSTFLSIPLDDQQQCPVTAVRTKQGDTLTCDDINENNGVYEYSNTEFGSPLHVTPLFRALAATIPSPKFSESEKHFLMKTLGMESTSASPVTNASQPPPCKRSLLHCL